MSLGGGRHPLRNQLEELHVAAAETAISQGADVQDPQESALADQRHPQHGLDALLPEDRIGHRGGVDPIEHDRPLDLGYPTGESSADRHADALTNLLLDATGRSGDQLLRCLVEQEHCRGVDRKDVANPVE